MLDKKAVTIVLDGVIVFGSVILGAAIKGMQNRIDQLTIENQLKDVIIKGQHEIIEKYIHEKMES
jgi:hypothetical protein